jgi:lipoprotein-releasing system permease protein
VNLISTISILGVTIGVAALIVVMSVYNGFSGLVSSILVSFDPHVRIERMVRADTSAYTDIVRYLDNYAEVKDSSRYAPFIAGKALIVSRNVNRVVNIRGIQADRIARVSGVGEKMVLGSLDFSSGHGIVLGMVLADRLGVLVGDTIAIMSPAGAELAALQMGLPLIKKFRVVGMYESNNKDYDSYYAFTDLPSAQALFIANGKIDGYDVRLPNPDHADKLRNGLREHFGNNYKFLTWYDLHRELYMVMQLERWAAFIVLCLIIAVASFNLLGSLTMTVVQKHRDIGILKAMGATNESIKRIFFTQGVLVGCVGTIAGTFLGLAVVFAQQRYHIFPLDPTVYIISAIPVEIHIIDIVIVGFAAIGLCTIASRRPANNAAQLLPAKAIRWE